MERVRWFEFIWLPTFERSARKLLDELCECVYMIVAYPKGKKESLTNSEENELRQLARKIKHEEH